MNILPSYNYQYFDSYNQLKTKSLNVIEVFLRKVFGLYTETHLLNVVKRGYTLTLKNDFSPSPQKRKDFFNLIRKVPFEKDYFPLESDAMSIRYVINEDSTLSSIDFKIKHDHSLYPTNHQLSLYKNIKGRLVVKLPFELFGGFNTDQENSIKTRLSSEFVKTINDLVANLIKQEVFTYMSDYQWMMHGYSYTSPDKLNMAQNESMEQLGWKYHEQFVKQGNISTTDCKRVYLMTPKECPNSISLSFALNSLTNSINEYCVEV